MSSHVPQRNKIFINFNPKWGKKLFLHEKIKKNTKRLSVFVGWRVYGLEANEKDEREE